MPLTPQGYTYPRLIEILTDLRNKAVEVFNDITPEGESVNVGDNSIIGRQIAIISPALADVWEATQELHDAFNINAATGVSLDNLCALGGVARQPASGTVTLVSLTGDINTVIPTGTALVSTNNNKFHSTLSNVVLDKNDIIKAVITPLNVANSTAYTFTYTRSPDSQGIGPTTITYTSDSSATASEIVNGLASILNTAPHNAVFQASVTGNNLNISTLSAQQRVKITHSVNLNTTKVTKTVSCVCDEKGPIETPINSITKIPVPIFGLDSVTNAVTGIVGKFIETDAELRARYIVSKFGDGSNLIESLYSALYAVEGVESVSIIENDTDTAIVTPTPVPPHSFYVNVLGGSSQEIANTIWKNKPAGILSYGIAETVTVLDSQGIGHVINFDRPVSVDIYVTINLTVQPAFPSDGVDQIKAGIEAYILSLNVGEDVLYSRLYQPINAVDGHYVNSLTIGTSPSPTGTSNLSINFNEKATITAANIIVITS